ncbi:choloylglycine hydrolase family protein [Lactococcus taiwanensis]|uniref:choloylglycine hydrolase family protein n=1 Tax=Lactococcus taiwanensis TaxID=1151742 RepID=UPI0028A203C3|nr:choloylglycine hydrolase family protein [Lactococcus taiwanensis]
MIGCSSFTLETEDKKHLLSRTMDFQIEMAEQVVFIPRDKTFKTSYRSQTTITSEYCCLGMGELSESGPILFDGINEMGVTAATLYFPRFAEYSKEALDKQAIAPDKVVPTVLTRAQNLQEVRQLFEQEITIVDESNPTLNVTPPLHYIFSDKSGQSLIIEPRAGGIVIIEDSMGVMTNSPDYHWHETNLRNYLSFTPHQRESVNFLGGRLDPFGQGSGTFGLPGDFTPPSRFVRTAFLKNYTTVAANEIEGVTLSHHILASISLPKGIVITASNSIDYTCYTASMCSESGSYYYSTYNNQRIRKISLTPALKNELDYKEFPVNNEEDILSLN